MVTIRGEWVNLAMGSILIWEVRDDFQCEFLAFYLAEMFKGTLCRKITFYIINNFSILSRMSLIISMKRSHWTILTRLGIYNVVMSLSGKNYLKIRLTTQQLSFLISNILCKIVVNDLLNNQNILKDIFEEKRGQRQKWWRREKVEIFRIFKWHNRFSLVK